MVKIFFPALDVDFSELCNIQLTLCHHTVNKIIEQNCPSSVAFAPTSFSAIKSILKMGPVHIHPLLFIYSSGWRSFGK
jgi:hypothetical protein